MTLPQTQSFVHSCQPRAIDIAEQPQELVMQYLPLVRAIAWQIYGSLPAHALVEMGDVLQAGHVGLVNASLAYRPKGAVPFGSFARHRIRGEILDSLRRLDSASRGLRRWQRQMETETRTLTAVLSREPSEEELSERMGVNVDALRKRRLTLSYSASCSSTRQSAGEGEMLHDVPAAPESRPDRLHQRVEMRKFLVRAVSVLPPRSRKVVLLYYLRNLTMKEIGAVLKVNESRISQIHKHALQTMSRGLRVSGVSSSKDI